MRNGDARWIERNSALMLEMAAEFFESARVRRLLNGVLREELRGKGQPADGAQHPGVPERPG